MPERAKRIRTGSGYHPSPSSTAAALTLGAKPDKQLIKHFRRQFGQASGGSLSPRTSKFINNAVWDQCSSLSACLRAQKSLCRPKTAGPISSHLRARNYTERQIAEDGQEGNEYSCVGSASFPGCSGHSAACWLLVMQWRPWRSKWPRSEFSSGAISRIGMMGAMHWCVLSRWLQWLTVRWVSSSQVSTSGKDCPGANGPKPWPKGQLQPTQSPVPVLSGVYSPRYARILSNAIPDIASNR